MKKISLRFGCCLATVVFVAVLSFSGCSQSKSASASAGATPPVRGSENAALTIEQFSDFSCPYCREQAQVLEKVMRVYPGKVRLSFRHFPLSGTPEMGSFPTHEASMCAAEQGKFWEFFDYTFNLDKKFDLSEAVQKLNLKQPQLNECMSAHRYRDFVLADLAEARKRGIDGVPASFMNGERVDGMRPFEFFAEKLDPEFAQTAEAKRKQADEELLRRINVSEEGRPAAGPENASITITEFSDFDCPFCAQLTVAIQELMAVYPQDVRRVWRHFPLPIHPQSSFVHLASECAHEQGKFWEFHDYIFSNQGAAHSKQDLQQAAEKIKLDPAQFQACYEKSASRKKIENDVLLGLYRKVGSTPTFFVNDEMFIGAKSLDDLKSIVARKKSESEKNRSGEKH